MQLIIFFPRSHFHDPFNYPTISRYIIEDAKQWSVSTKYDIVLLGITRRIYLLLLNIFPFLRYHSRIVPPVFCFKICPLLAFMRCKAAVGKASLGEWLYTRIKYCDARLAAIKVFILLHHHDSHDSNHHFKICAKYLSLWFFFFQLLVWLSMACFCENRYWTNDGDMQLWPLHIDVGVFIWSGGMTLSHISAKKEKYELNTKYRYGFSA